MLEWSKEPHTQQRGSTPSEMPKRPPHRKEGARKKGQQMAATSQGPTTGKSMHVRKGPKGNPKSNQASITRQ